mgnify:CR=1 FL=1|jgi:hypothetical protein
MKKVSFQLSAPTVSTWRIAGCIGELTDVNGHHLPEPFELWDLFAGAHSGTNLI